MAKSKTIKVTYSCGHTESKRITFNKAADRDSKIEYLESEADCSVCWDCQRREENAKSAVENARLVRLEGSDKQVAWAESIRSKHIAVVNAAVEFAKNKMGTAVELSDEVKEELLTALGLVASEIVDNSSASWWIDNRETYHFLEHKACFRDLQKQIFDRKLAPLAMEALAARKK